MAIKRIEKSTKYNNTAPQAFINSSTGEPRGFFHLSNRIEDSIFEDVLERLNTEAIQNVVSVEEGVNKNGKTYFRVSTSKGLLGFVQGATEATIEEWGTLVFSNMVKVDDADLLF